jgi:hypothetical protein
LVPSQPPARVLAKARSKGRWPLVLAIVVGVLSLICVGGLGIAYHLYDKATTPNRTVPDAAVNNYLRATFIHHNASEANEFACTDQSGLAAFKSFAGKVVSEPSISVDWAGLVVKNHGSSDASVTVVLQLEQDGGSSGEENSSWTFTTHKSSDWRVCGASPT